MARVTLNGVQKTFPDGHRAVRDFSLDVADGEFVVLVGPSGCGKTTTLRMIAGLEDITAGEVQIDGRVVNALHPKDRDVAMVFQTYALYPHMTAYENIAFALQLRGMKRDDIDRRVRQAAVMLGLRDQLEKKPAALSGGQRQRVAVARAIVREPRVFLFDEPLSNLDSRQRAAARAEIRSLQSRLKATTIYVTHDQEEAMTMGDRIVVMYAGVVQQAGTPMDVYHRPANRFVAGFIGSPPMNFIEGRLEVNVVGPSVFVECRENEREETWRSDPSPSAPAVPASGSHGPAAASAIAVGERDVAAPARLILPNAWIEQLAAKSAVAGSISGGTRDSSKPRAKGESGPNRRVVLGIRPQHLHLASGPAAHTSAVSPARCRFHARISYCEPLGDSIDLHAKTDAGATFVARVPAIFPAMGAAAGLPEIGTRVEFSADIEHAALFAPGAVGVNLLL